MDDDDSSMEKALKLSMASTDDKPNASPQQQPAASAPAAAETPAPVPFFDPAFVNSMLASLPGVDPNDPRILQALQQIQAKQDQGKKSDDKPDPK
jgi:26S proteasome regulatory subunit N10